MLNVILVLSLALLRIFYVVFGLLLLLFLLCFFAIVVSGGFCLFRVVFPVVVVIVGLFL